jgi:tyrosine-protein kinase Etk/Wzc
VLPLLNQSSEFTAMNDPTLSLSQSHTAEHGDEISLLDLLQLVVDNLRMLILLPLLIGLTALGLSFRIPPTFVATTKFMPPQQQQSSTAALLQSLGSLGGLAGAATGLKNPNDQFVSLLTSRTVQDKLIQDFGLVERYDVKYSEDARVSLLKKATVNGGKDGLITVSVEDNDPLLAARLANAHVVELSSLLARLAITEAQQRRAFFEAQLAKAKDGLTKAEQALLTTGVSANVIKSRPEGAVGGLAALQAGIAAQEVKVASMRGYLAESAPDFRQAMTELSALRSQLKRAEQSQLSGSASDSDYIAKYRDFKYYETLFELFAKQFELARIDESREGAVIQVVDVALPPERKSKPKKGLIAVVATLASGFILLLFVFVRHAVQRAQKDEEGQQKLVRLRRSFRKALGRAA